MDFELSREQQMLKDMVKSFAESEIAPQVQMLDEKAEFPRQLWKKSAELGLVGIVNSPEYGGSAMGHLARMIMIEEISAVYPAVGFCFQTCQIGMYGIEEYGTEAQKRKYLPGLCKGDDVITWAVTEPTGGSDPASTQTTAELSGDDYIVNGRKIFITGGEAATLHSFLAKSGDSMVFLIADKNTAGFSVPRREESLGLRCVPVNELAFTNCRIPKENLLGQEGKGLAVALSSIAVIGRTGAAGVSLGIAEGAYQAALKFARERTLYGKPISKLQSIQFDLANMKVEIEAAKWLCYNAAWLLDQGKSTNEIAAEIAMAKLYSTDIASKVCIKAIEILGGYGLNPDYHITRRLRDAIEMLPAAGTQNIMRILIGSSITR